MLKIRRFSLALLVMAGLTLAAPTSRAVDPRLLPGNTEVVFTLNIKQMLNSELAKSNKEVIAQVKAAFEQAPLDEVAKYLKEMGFDPFTDLTSVTVAHTGNQDPKEGMVIIDGAFNAAKFERAAAKAIEAFPGTLRISSKTKAVIIYEIQTPVGQPAYVALVGKSVVLAPSEEEIKGAMSRSAGTRVEATKVKELLKTTNDKQSLSIVITGEALGRLAQNAPQAGNIPQVAQALAAIDGITGAITMTKEINFQLGIGAKDAMTAQDIVNAGQAGLFFLNMMAANKAKMEPDFQPVVEVLRTLRISSVGNNALLTGSVSSENLQKLLKTLGNQFKGGGF